MESIEVSTPKLNKLISASDKAGSFGAKLSGAGGGDCMIAFTDHSHKNAVASAIKKAGGTVLDINTGAEGVRIEKK